MTTSETAAATAPANSVRRRWLTRRTLWRGLAVAVGGLILLEVLLRAALGLGNPVLYQRDKECGYLFVPSADSTRFFARNHINQFSMRSQDIDPHKPRGTLRVMVIGDSVVYGTTYVDQSLIFTSLIQDQLAERLHQPVEVLNVSAGGWAPENELAYLRSRGTFEADVVIMELNTGDLTQPFSTDDFVVALGLDKKPAFAIEEAWTRYIRPALHRERQENGSTFVAAPAEQTEVLAQATTRMLQTLANVKQLVNRARAASRSFTAPCSGSGSPAN